MATLREWFRENFPEWINTPISQSFYEVGKNAYEFARNAPGTHGDNTYVPGLGYTGRSIEQHSEQSPEATTPPPVSDEPLLSENVPPTETLGEKLRRIKENYGLTPAEYTMADTNERNPTYRNANNLLTPQPAQEPAPTQLNPASSPGQQKADEATNQGLAAAKAEKEAREKERQDALDAQFAREKQLQDWYGQTPENDRRYMNAPYFRTAQEREYATQLTQLKWMYDNAESIAKAQGLRPDQVQQQVSEQASLLREQAAAAGIQGLEGYGPGVTLHDTLRYLQSNDERARADALNRYADSSQDVYDRQFDKYILQGKNSRIANVLAERDARAYQKERLNFQRDMYHTYGLEGGYANDWATQILAQMAEENPALANYYTKLHGTPKELLGHQQELENKLIEQQNAYQKDFWKYVFNEKFANSTLGRKLIEMVEQGKINLQNGVTLATLGSDLTEGREVRKELRARQQKEAEIERNINIINQAEAAGQITSADAAAMRAGVYGITFPKNGVKNSSKEARDGYKDFHAMVTKRHEAARKRLEDIEKTMVDLNGNLTPDGKKQYEAVQQEIKDLEQTLREAENSYREILESDQPPDPHFSPSDMNQTIINARAFYEGNVKDGYSPEDVLDALTKQLKKAGFEDDQIPVIINALGENNAGAGIVHAGSGIVNAAPGFAKGAGRTEGDKVAAVVSKARSGLR